MAPETVRLLPDEVSVLPGEVRLEWCCWQDPWAPSGNPPATVQVDEYGWGSEPAAAEADADSIVAAEAAAAEGAPGEVAGGGPDATSQAAGPLADGESDSEDDEDPFGWMNGGGSSPAAAPPPAASSQQQPLTPVVPSTREVCGPALPRPARTPARAHRAPQHPRPARPAACLFDCDRLS